MRVFWAMPGKPGDSRWLADGLCKFPAKGDLGSLTIYLESLVTPNNGTLKATDVGNWGKGK